ncbi:Na+/H+ antiporter [Chitinophaga deserti]|uniref:Na+/H+ antiporter n=1 Tax=Chitinophaga deserti TaxID=2164099 RepID=UPI000D6D1E0A|nr:Na+/H+ antiporter [Chitinophaga deserti]
MEHYKIILLLLGIMILISAFADRNKLASPVLLIISGIAVGFIPGMPVIQINPEIIFLLFLPPLLFDAAYNMHFDDFKRHFRTISSLAIGLVFLTAAAIAVMSYYLIPEMTWPLSFLLGAILSATDAVAAIGITKNLKLTRNTMTILEGESLINDASALVAYRFALAAVAGGAFIWVNAIGTFIKLLVGGFVTGLIMAILAGLMLRYIRGHLLAVLSVILIAPFVTYLLAEAFHFSGVIAVVVLAFGISKLAVERFPETVRAQSKTLWEVLVFILNGLIFLFIGLEFPLVIESIEHTKILPYCFYALLIVLVTVIVRFIRLFFIRRNLEGVFRRLKPDHSHYTFLQSIMLSIQESWVIGWAGMRGIVSLAMAIALPHTPESGLDPHMRNVILFITTVVVLISILGQGLVLPMIIRKMDAKES